MLGGAPTAVVVRLEDRVLRLAPPFARVVTAVGEAGWRVRARGPRWAVELEGSAAGAPAVLPVPVVAERRVEERSQQYLAGSLRVVLRRGRRVVWRGESGSRGWSGGGERGERQRRLGREGGLTAAAARFARP